MKKLKVLTWQVHGNYLFYLSHVPHELYVPFDPARGADYTGCFNGFPWPNTVVNVPVERIASLDLDCVLYQRPNHFLKDQYDLLTADQRRLPRIYLEHDPPQEHPTNTRHIVDDPDVLLVHVTPFNRLMWDSGRSPTRVIDHGVTVPPGIGYTGELQRGLVVVNNLKRRGRRLGADIVETVRKAVPLDIVGMNSEEAGGLGEIGHDELARFEVRYRFLFNPIRYTSLGLAVCEAMLLGMPVVGIASTEMAKAVENGVSGYVDTDVVELISRMYELLRDHDLARKLGQGAQAYARRRFNIHRFVRDWNEAFSLVTG
ncbi:MAG: transferase [Nitrospirae bacterium GWD2_57_9]|nr:MAG: transferase [Nitrospirae bacterium GWD2_57_9]